MPNSICIQYAVAKDTRATNMALHSIIHNRLKSAEETALKEGSHHEHARASTENTDDVRIIRAHLRVCAPLRVNGALTTDSGDYT